MQPSPIQQVPSTQSGETAVPLFVDLDGSLLRTDLLVESALALLRRNVLYLLPMLFWLWRGKAWLKHQLARRVDLPVAELPYSQALLAHLQRARAEGRRLVLLTAANEKYAHAVAGHLGLFDAVRASDAGRNLSPVWKLSAVGDLAGGQPFDYAGNARVDLLLWRRARRPLLVNPRPGVAGILQREGRPFELLQDTPACTPASWLRALRLHQWLKNLLVFAPLVLAHRLDEPLLLLQALLAFLAFGLCASAIYLFNDLMDLPDDRRHPLKRRRPFASGEITVERGLPLLLALPILTLGLGSLLPAGFLLVTCLYAVLALAYSLGLKRLALLDVLLLAGLYTLRIFGGAEAVAVPLSFWLVAFSLFLFLGLALLKRYTELQGVLERGLSQAAGRGYRTVDLETLAMFGIAAACTAVLALALYIDSAAVTRLYTRPQLIWLLCPLLLYMQARLWLLARRGELHEDPLVFLLTDRPGLGLAAAGALLLWAAL